MSLLQVGLGEFQIDAGALAIVIISLIVFFTIAVIWGIRAHRRQISAGREELIGKAAEVKIALQPKGTVFIQGEQWTAISETGNVEPGEEVVVTKVDGLKLYVTKK